MRDESKTRSKNIVKHNNGRKKRKNTQLLTSQEFFTLYIDFLIQLGFDISKSFERSKLIFGDRKKYYRFVVHTMDSYVTVLNEAVSWRFMIVVKKHIQKIFSSDFLKDFKRTDSKVKILKNDRSWKKDNLALFEHFQSSIILLDIDTHTPQFEKGMSHSKYILLIHEILAYIENYSGAKPIFTEISSLNRGAHIYFKICRLNERTRIANLLALLIKENWTTVNIDIRSNKKAIRIPFSVDYIPYSFDKKAMIPVYREAIAETLLNISNPDFHLQFDEIRINLLIEKPSIFTKEQGNEFDSDLPLWKKTTGKQIENIGRIEITEGNRYGGTKQIFRAINHCIRRGLDEENTLKQCLEWNAGSKDLTAIQLNAYGKEAMEFKRLYNLCKTNFDPRYYSNKPDSNGENAVYNDFFISNLRFLTPIDLEFIEEAVKRYPSNRKSTKEKFRFVLLETVGKYNYDVHLNRREVNENIPLSHKIKEKLVLGGQFPDLYFKRIKKSYKIKFSVKNFKDYILNKSGLFVQIDNGIKGGFLNYPNLKSCKQYYLTYENSAEEHLKNLNEVPAEMAV
ncbi:hypothetical protein [Leptospira interrogans]|uniref:hypothetical protein n=1 Tax=Leptospira interrogans TaxID=173 RepID=UPI000349A5D0|nr:hypothetical protein [Leptospira interrogans]QCO33443.1 hypothetical protein E4414_10395 [Leptospira interrogans]UMQ55827.1 hypothetical protein FH582_10265 [Leptospira interrogans]